MSKVKTIQLSEVLSALPDFKPMGENSLNSRSDLFLCALGFEPRCLTIPLLLARSGFRTSRAVYLEPSTNRTDNRINLPGLLNSLSQMSNTVEPLESDSLDFTERLGRLLSLLSERSENAPIVYLDVSVLSNRALVKVMKAVLEADVQLVILYAEAAVYHPTREEFERDVQAWKEDAALGLERGVSEVFPSKEYPGLHLDPLPDYLILFPSFKAERTRAVIARVDPSLLALPAGKLFWIVGTPRLAEDQWRIEAMRTLNEIDSNAPQSEVSTFDYKDTLKRLEAIYTERWRGFNITVSPLGSKLQAIGTALFCYMHPGVRLMFAIPKEYNAAHYSEGCKSVWSLELGHTAMLRRQLQSVGSLTIV